MAAVTGRSALTKDSLLQETSLLLQPATGAADGGCCGHGKGDNSASDTFPCVGEDCASETRRIAAHVAADKSRNSCRTHSTDSVTDMVPLPDLQHRTDDELTSLTWLQDSNFLFGTALSQMKGITSSEKHVPSGLKDAAPTPVLAAPTKMDEVKAKPVEIVASPETESPSSEMSEERDCSLDPNEKEDEIIESPQSTVPDQDPVPYNPQVHIKSKPPYSFSSLIFMAIEDSIEKALPVKDIYSWVIRHFPYFRGAPTGWKNSVRHNLSLNKCFRKVDKSPTLGKGSLWMVDPAYRPNLLQTLNKTPFPSTNRTDHIYVTNVRSALNRDPLDHLKRLIEGAPPMYPEKSPEPPPQVDGNLYKNDHPSDKVFCRLSLNSAPSQTYVDLQLQERPMLLKRVHKDDVDAAAAMLVLKHGPTFLEDNPHFAFNASQSVDSSVVNGYRSSGRKRKQSHTELQDPNYTRNTQSLDHSYVSAMDGGEPDSHSNDKRLKTSSPPETTVPALSNSSLERARREWMESDKSDAPLYEANALLKLASIATSLASTDITPKMTYFNGHATDSTARVSNIKTLNGTNSHRTEESTHCDGISPPRLSSRKKKNLHPVKRVLNADIKKLSNNNSCSILNKNEFSQLDYRI